MKIYFAFLFVLIFFSCESGSEKQDESNDSDSLPQIVEYVDPPAKPVSDVDTFLYHFAKENLKPGKHLLNVKYKYNVQRDTLVYNRLDSIIIYKYPVDSMVKYYSFPYSWSNVFQGVIKDEIKNNIDDLLSLLHKANSCQGIIYSGGNQLLEVFIFENENDAKNAKKLFDGSQDYLFPKTLSFAAFRKNNFYIFHARYMGPSWQSKKDFEKFENQK